MRKKRTVRKTKKPLKKSAKKELGDLILRDEILDLAERLNIKIVFNDLNESQGGLCRIKNQYYIYLNSSMSIKQQISLLLREIARIDLSKIYLKPSLRKLIES